MAKDPWREALEIVRDALAPKVEARLAAERTDWLSNERKRRLQRRSGPLNYLPLDKTGRVVWDPPDLLSTISIGRPDVLMPIFVPDDPYIGKREIERRQNKAIRQIEEIKEGRNGYMHFHPEEELGDFLTCCARLLKLAQADQSYIVRIRSLSQEERSRPRFVAAPQQHIRIFVAHSDQDVNEAESLANYLSSVGYEALTRRGLAKQLRAPEEYVSHSQFVLVLVSDASLDSPVLRQDIEAARLAAVDASGYCPLLVPVYSAYADWPLVGEVAKALFSNWNSAVNLPIAPGFDAEDPESELVDLLRPILRVSRLDFSHEEVFDETGVFKLYEALFPESERDEPADIEKWVLRSDIGQPRTFRLDGGTDGGLAFEYQLDSRFCILQVMGLAVGFAFVTYDYRSNILYGNYIGVEKHWRRGGWAKAFASHIEDALSTVFQEFRGIAFEVETVDATRVDSIISDLESSSRTLLFSDEEEALRRFLRVCMYEQQLEFFTFVDKNSGAPIVCRSPCLDPDIPQAQWKSREEQYWLMWRGRGGEVDARRSGALWVESVKTIYLEILTKSLVERFPRVAVDYWNYATSIVDDNIRNVDETKIIIGPYAGHKEMRLWMRLKTLMNKRRFSIAI